jgi:hypothetical protein
MSRLVVLLLFAGAACSRNSAYRENAKVAPAYRVSGAIDEAVANPAAMELRNRDRLLRFSGVVAATGVDDFTVVEDRRAACAVATGFGAMGASIQGQPQAPSYCASTRVSSRRVPYAVFADDAARGAFVCYMSRSDELTIANLSIGRPANIAGTVRKVTTDPTVGIVITATDCIVLDY